LHEFSEGRDGMSFQVRKAVAADVPRLREVIEASVRGLQAGDYSPAQIEGALQSVYGVDSQLIADGTYFVVEPSEQDDDEHSRGSVGAPHAVPAVTTLEKFQPGATAPLIVAGGGWSKRKTLYGGDQYAQREDSLLDPARDAAKIRAFFVHPDWARRGIGTLILEACENAARKAGFTRLEMGATLSGVAFYRAKGYAPLGNLEVRLSNGEMLSIVRMAKEFK
jgi:GNAT superfamily N-acetyltransferase